MANRNRVKSKKPRSAARSGRAAPKEARPDIRVVRELRSGFGSYEIVPVVNDLLRRGWVLLGAGFVAQPGAEGREFLYVLGATDVALLDKDAPAASTDYSEMEAFVRSVGTDVDAR